MVGLGETDALLRRLAELVKFPEEKLDAIITLLGDIKGLLTVAPPPAGAVSIANLDELRDKIVEALELYNVLHLANDLYVATIDLSTARDKPTEVPELAGAVSLTVFRLTGTMDLYLQKADGTRKFTLDAITYPQTFFLDNFKVERAFVANTAQSGKEAVLIAWKKV